MAAKLPWEGAQRPVLSVNEPKKTVETQRTLAWPKPTIWSIFINVRLLIIGCPESRKKSARCLGGKRLSELVSGH